MPELPEIEVIRRDLEKEVLGRRIKHVEVRPGSNAMKIVPRHGRRKEVQDLLTGAKVAAVDRVGKHLLLVLDNGHVLRVTLGDAGRLTKSPASENMAAHTHLVISFTIGGQLRVADPKVRSEVHVAPVSDMEEYKTGLRDFLIDPLEDQFTWHRFSAELEKRAAPLKQVLADQSFIVGLGDVYSDELLWHAGLRHDRASHKLSSQDVRRLYRSLMEMLQGAVKARGTTWDEADFHDLLGKEGEFQAEIKVYERQGQPCRRCRSAIVREEVDGMSTYLCAQCQA